MLSVIVSSINEKLFQQLCENIQQTAGVVFEIIKVEKDENHLGICHAYNYGAAKAQYPYLLFLHEDVAFVTKNWGVNLIDHFKTSSEIGLIGLAGNICKMRMSCTWPQSNIKNTEAKRVNIIQHFKYKEGESIAVRVNPDNVARSPVVTLDGVFLATTKDVWLHNRFDETLLKGFHGYDLDYCLQVGLTKKIFVVYDILIEHFSDGNCDVNCMKEYFKVHRKWKQHLPVTVNGYQWDEEYNYGRSWLKLNQTIRTLVKANKNYFFVFSSFFFLSKLVDFKCYSWQWWKDLVRNWYELNIYYLKFHLRKFKRA